MEILLWLLPSVVVTCAAMAWVSWLGRERPERERSDLEQERFAQAVMRPHAGDIRRPRQRERSTGVAVRRDGRPAAGPSVTPSTSPDTRRSA